MARINRMVGTPWHVERFERKEDDPRRHRTRCRYYVSQSKHCTYRCGVCIGSAHCSHYDEKVEQQVVEQQEKVMQTLKPFSGVKEIDLNLIEVDLSKAETPKKSKVDKLIQFYNQHGTLDKPIIVSIRGDKFILKDKYLRYYVAKELGLKKILAEMSTKSEIKIEDQLRKTGTKVRHQKYGEGVVIAVDLSYVTVRFEDGKEKKFDIALTIKNKYLFIQ